MEEHYIVSRRYSDGASEPAGVFSGLDAANEFAVQLYSDTDDMADYITIIGFVMNDNNPKKSNYHYDVIPTKKLLSEMAENGNP